MGVRIDLLMSRRGRFASHNVGRVGTTIERKQQEEAGYC